MIDGPAKKILTPLCVLVLLATASATLRSQEFLDTAGRWKSLDLGPAGPAALPRSIVAHQATVLIGRESGSVLISRDSGETWRDLGIAGKLPAGIRITWALAHVDTVDPNRMIGLALFRPSAGGDYAAIIESSDGGEGWSEGTRIPALNSFLGRPQDTIFLAGRPEIQFVHDYQNNRRVGFLSCGPGIWVTNDTGRTWIRNDAVTSTIQLRMADARRGAGAVKLPRHGLGATFGAIAVTSDGGATWKDIEPIRDNSFRFPVLSVLDTSIFRLLLPNRHRNLYEWILYASNDGGQTFERREGYSSPRPLWGRPFWLDSGEVHVICDGAAIQHSYDGAIHFNLLRDSTPGYTESALLLIPLMKGPVAARDNRYIYLAGRNNLAARWRFAPPGPRVVASLLVAENASSDMTLRLGPGGEGRLELRLDERADVDLAVYDMLGGRVADLSAGTLERGLHQLPLDLSSLGNGRYILCARIGERVESMPVAVVR